MSENAIAVPSLSFDHKVRLAESFANSGLFGIKTVDQAIALMALCEAEGMHPAIAVRDYHIIQGKPALKADAMLARFQKAGGKVNWLEMTDERVAGEFSHSAGGSVMIDWDKARAVMAGFWGKDNWKKFPRAMLRARVISEGVRTVYPGVVSGIYTPEEVQDFEPEKPKPRGTSARAECWEGVTLETRHALEVMADEVSMRIANNNVDGAVQYIADQDLPADEKVCLWDLLDSKQRSALKKAMRGAPRTESPTEAKPEPPIAPVEADPL